MHQTTVDPTNRRLRGRPRQIKIKKPSYYRVIFDGNEIESLSELISEDLKIPRSQLSDELARIVLSYLTLRALRKYARMKSGRTKRPNIHRVVLMSDIACAYARHAGTCPTAELTKINYGREQRTINKKSKGLATNAPPVEAITRTLLEVVGEKYHGSLRRTAADAKKFLVTDLLN
jgi:hypothetical protein